MADVVNDHDAAVIDLGTIGTRPCDIDPRVRQRPSTATHLVFVDEAGPCGSWRSRDLTQTGDDGWVVAPALIPQTAGDRVNTARRDAVPWARLRRSGDRTPVDVPHVEDDAMRDLSRARDETRHALKTAQCRLTACLRRHDLRSSGRATGSPTHRHWLSEVVGPTPRAPKRLASIGAGGARTHRTAPAAGTSTPRTRQCLAALSRRRSAPSPPWRAIDGGGHAPRRTCGPALRGSPATTQA